MSLQTCWRCLARAPDSSCSSILRRRPSPRIPIPIPISIPTSSFTTTATAAANPLTRKAPAVGVQKIARGVKKTYTRKKKRVEGVPRNRRPGIGERKAVRKRVVLSNTNALDVQDLPDITPESITDERVRSQVLGIPGSVVDRLRAVQAFKPRQSWSLFRKPAMLMRNETVEYGKLIHEISQKECNRVVRRVLVGERGSGKSTMLLQAMTMAFLKDWVVINIPDAEDLVIGQTEYSPLTQGLPTTYTQRVYIANLLSVISRSNPILETLQISPDLASNANNTPELPIPLPPNVSLARLAQLGAESPEAAHEIFNRLLAELALPGRPPLMFCLDGLAHAMRDTVYRDFNFNPIHAHQFHLISTFLSLFSPPPTTPDNPPANSFPNGAILLLSTSNSNSPRVPALTHALSSLEAEKPVLPDPLIRYDHRIISAFAGAKDAGVEVQRLGGVSKADTRSLMEFWARSGIFRGKVGQREVGEWWGVIGGGGVLGELVRGVRERV